MRYWTLEALTALVCLWGASAANAATIEWSLALSTSAGAPTPTPGYQNLADIIINPSLSFGAFGAIGGSASDQYLGGGYDVVQTSLNAAIDKNPSNASTSPQTLYAYFTEQNVPGYDLQTFLAGATVNTLTGGQKTPKGRPPNITWTTTSVPWTVNLQIFISPTNALFDANPNDALSPETGTQYTGPGGPFGIDYEDAVLSGSTDYSITFQYRVTVPVDPPALTQEGAANLTENLDYLSTPVPETSTWAMLGLGFAGLGYVGLRRPRSARSAF